MRPGIATVLETYTAFVTVHTESDVILAVGPVKANLIPPIVTEHSLQSITAPCCLKQSATNIQSTVTLSATIKVWVHLNLLIVIGKVTWPKIFKEAPLAVTAVVVEDLVIWW